eukprot:TRINITY_DN15041_c0_g1_i1.p1 TRINITY_DN15041_c0_g1~~TRINITY_DN15041_c0_g1_i1.p1  ORF type:complete len:633 (-),score=111.42 TRINITY_DN15041_c0_g1_i1:159-2015(-)
MARVASLIASVVVVLVEFLPAYSEPSPEEACESAASGADSDGTCNRHDLEGSPDSTSQEWSNFVEWFQSRGGVMQKDISRSVITNGPKKGMYGLVANADLKEGDVLFNVPVDMWLTASNFPEITFNVSLHGCAKFRPRLTVAAKMALELKKGDTSPWYPWIRLLQSPDEFRKEQVRHISSSLRHEFDGLPLVSVLVTGAQATEDQIARCVEAWQGAPDSPVADLTFDELMYFHEFSETRSFSSASEKTVLLPGVDFVNTGNDKDLNARYDFFGPGGVFQMKVHRDLKAGEEINIGYCLDCDNEYILATWGVYFEDNHKALHNLGSATCDTAGEQESLLSATSGSLRAASLAMLDHESAPASLELGLRAPPCKQTIDAMGNEDRLRCSLARLAWEYCAVEWGHTEWPGRGGDAHTTTRNAYNVAHNAIAALAERNKNVAVAQAHYGASIEADPKDPEARYQLGKILMDTGKRDDALKHMKAAVKLQPDLEPALFYTGRLLRDKDPQVAAKYFKKLLKLDPTATEAYNDLGIIAASTGEVDLAERRFKAALKINPRDLGAYANIAQLMYLKTDIAGAKKALQKMLEIDPTNEMALWRLNDLESKQNGGDADETDGAQKIA